MLDSSFPFLGKSLEMDLKHIPSLEKTQVFLSITILFVNYLKLENYYLITGNHSSMLCLKSRFLKGAKKQKLL
jgi:hypothetical protein